MRIRTSAVFAAALMALTPLVAAAQDAAPVKIGFVDVEKAVTSIAEGKARLKQLQDWAKPKQEEIGRLNDQVNDLQNELNTKQGAASDDAVADLNRRLIAKRRELEDKQRSGKREFDEKQNAILQDLGAKLNEVVTRYADGQRFTAVFILKPNDLVYLSNSADLTDTVIKLYDEKYPYPAAK